MAYRALLADQGFADFFLNFAKIIAFASSLLPNKEVNNLFYLETADIGCIDLCHPINCISPSLLGFKGTENAFEGMTLAAFLLKKIASRLFIQNIRINRCNGSVTDILVMQ